MPRRRIAGGITVMIVHGGLWRARAAGRVLGGERGTARPANGPVAGLIHNRLGSGLSNRLPKAAQLAPVTKACGP
jgi:hypothetical protein